MLAHYNALIVLLLMMFNIQLADRWQTGMRTTKTVKVCLSTRFFSCVAHAW